MLTEEWLQHVSGEWRLLSILKTPKLKADRTVEYVVCSAEDITEQKQAEEELLKTKERFDFALQATNTGLWDWNIQTGEVVFNEQWVAMVGYTLEELKPLSIQTWMDLCNPEDLKESNALLEKHFKVEFICLPDPDVPELLQGDPARLRQILQNLAGYVAGQMCLVWV